MIITEKYGNSPIVYRQMNKLTMVHSYNGILPCRNKELSTDTGSNMDETYMLNEGSQSQKATYGRIPFIGDVQNRQTYSDRR